MNTQHPEHQSGERGGMGLGLALGIGATLLLVCVFAVGLNLGRGSSSGVTTTVVPNTSAPSTSNAPARIAEAPLNDPPADSAPSTVQEAPMNEAPISDVASDVATTETSSTATSAVEGKGMLQFNTQKPMAVFLNEQKVADVQQRGSQDVTSFLRPGLNTLRLSWSEPMAFADIRVGYAPPGFGFGKATKIFLGPSETQRPGDKTLSFTLPDGSGIMPTVGSADNQTLLNFKSLKPMTVYLNGRAVGDSGGMGSRASYDISKAMRPGLNTVRVVWPGPVALGEVKVVHAATKDNFREVAKVSILAPESNSAGEKSFTFTHP